MDDVYGFLTDKFSIEGLIFASVCVSVISIISRVKKSQSARKINHHEENEVVIIGSGILGSALATTLARQGRNVVVIERSLKQPDRIVGELLQPGGCEALRELGLEECLEGFDAHHIHGYFIHNNTTGKDVVIPYPSNQEGRAFHHGRFVMALRATASKEPNVRYIEGTVKKLQEIDGTVTGVSYTDRETGETKELRAGLTVVADGCFSKLRKGLVKDTPFVKSHFVGALMHDCPQSKTNHAELVLTDIGPILIYQISSNDTRILVDVKGGLPKNVKDYLKEEIYSQLPEHIQDSFLDAVESNQIRSMPNNFLPPNPIEKPGVLCLGDALNMRHPLTGGGMSVALNDVILVRDLFKSISHLGEYDQVRRQTRVLFGKRKNNHSFVVNILAQALYELFAARDESLKRLKNACFAYFELGGECVNGPVGLLSILRPKPHILLGHFFAVALYAIYFSFKEEPIYRWYRSVGTSVGILGTALSIIVPLIWSEVKTLTKY